MKGIEVNNLKFIEENGNFKILDNQKGKITIFWNEFEKQKLDIVVGKNTELDFLEINEKDNSELNLIINNNAIVRYNSFCSNENGSAIKQFILNENSYLLVGYADFSKGKKTFNAKVELNGEFSKVEWHLASLTQNEDQKIYNINFMHNNQNTFAKMDNYGVCKDKSTLSFIGDAIIFKGSKKSSTKQNAKIMVFDKNCHACASPKLCIYENDVEASHGASEGQINPDHIFYLTSRGIKEDDAKRLITLGYLNPITKYFTDEAICEEIRNCIMKEI